MLRLLVTPRWLAFTGLVIAAIVGFGVLSSWQFHRAEEKRLQAATVLKGTGAEPVPVIAGAEPPEWSTVELLGSFGAGQVAVRQRPQEGANGWWVLAPLRTAAGTVWVARGWLRAEGPATALPALPAPPPGQVAVRGTWHPFEAVDPGRQEGLPSGMASAVAPTALGEPSALNGYVRATSPEPDPETRLVPIAVPEADDLRNTSYAWQWILFAVVAMTGWFVFLRREAREDAAHGR